jgi:hypothetical protein
MLTTPRTLGLALGMVFMVGCGDGGSSGPCEALEDCCRSLEDDQRDHCLTQQKAAADSATPRVTCDALRDSYRAAGMCGGGSSSDDEDEDVVLEETTTGDGDGDGDSSDDVCDSYIRCAGVASPETLPSLISTYGPKGTCWSSGESIAATCIEACAEGLSQLEAQGECESDDVSDDEELIAAYCANLEMCAPGQVPDCAATLGSALEESTDVSDECAVAVRGFAQCVSVASCDQLGNCPSASDACEIDVPTDDGIVIPEG